MVPVSYREKIRVSRSEINFFWNIFFMVLTINRVEKIIGSAEKIIGSAEKNRVGRKK